jgi:TnpA family transposase
MLPTDTHGRRTLAADRYELLRNPPAPRPAGSVRRRLAALLVGAAMRLAPEAAPRPRASR